MSLATYAVWGFLQDRQLNRSRYLSGICLVLLNGRQLLAPTLLVSQIVLLDYQTQHVFLPLQLQNDDE